MVLAIPGGSPGTVPVEWALAGVADFNGDEKSDILWRNTGTVQTSVWLMNGKVKADYGYPGTVALEWKIQ